MQLMENRFAQNRSVENLTHGTLLWEPSPERIEQANITAYRRWLKETYGLSFESYNDLWTWSVTNLEAFWESIATCFDLHLEGDYSRVVSSFDMPGARWFEGTRVNYAEHVFRQARGDEPAIIAKSEVRPEILTMSWNQLEAQVASVAKTLRDLGVVPGDRVAAYLPNIPETVVAFLACASVGAVWSSCSPDFGVPRVIARFQQIEPKVLFAIDGYSYKGKAFDRRPVLSDLQEAMPSLKATIVVPYLHPNGEVFGSFEKVPTLRWPELLTQPAKLEFAPLPFEHPLWILYSSGTTGLPKALVHSTGGILISLLAQGRLQSDTKPGDRVFWFTTTGWVMWNAVVGNLALGAAAVLYDGNPFYPSVDVLWELAEQSGMTAMGVSPAYLSTVMKSGLSPRSKYDLSKLKSFSSTGAPMTPEAYAFVYESVHDDIWLGPISGGTDVVAFFVGGCPILPVRAGEMQCRALGVKAEAFNSDGQPVIDEVGELVISAPMPSMPLYLWNDDEQQSRYHDSYFAEFPGVWRHGDWIRITPEGSAIIYGRSDSTINRQGVRMGSSEIYRAVEALPEVADSLVVDLEYLGRPSYMPLFVVLVPGAVLDDELTAKIQAVVRSEVSPRHIPDEIHVIDEVPRTLNGKKLEVPIRKILMGFPMAKSVDPNAMSNPDTLDDFVRFAQTLAGRF